jgi:hypothetical protein
MFFLFSTATASYTACTFGGIDSNSWIQINTLLLVIAISLGGVFYAFSNLLPLRQGEKMKGMVKAEIFQGIIGIVIVLILFTSAVTWCNIGASLTSSSGITASNPMTFSESYLQKLLFSTGLSLFTKVYSESAILFIDGQVLNSLSTFIERLQVSYKYVAVSFAGIGDPWESYALAFVESNTIIFSVVFGVLFVIYLVLPIVYSTALTVVVPTALVMRMVPFLGPKIREVSDAIFSIAIAAYFIFPLMIIMNQLFITAMYTPCTATTTALCNPYSSYLSSYNLANIPVSSLFSNPQENLGSGFSISANFFQNIITSTGGILPTIERMFTDLVFFPSLLVSYSQDVAIFAFQGVFLIGLDILVTVAFAQAVTKGLNSVSGYVSGGGFWG